MDDLHKETLEKNQAYSSGHQRPKSRIAWGKVFIPLFVIALFAVLILNAGEIKKMFGLGQESDDSYYAIFLTNNEVYFGKISENTESRITLSNVYYLNAQSVNASSSALALIKLGQEVHGPADAMYIPVTSITFYEKLRPDSAVVKYMQEGK